MEVTNSGNRWKSARLEKGKNNLHDVDLSNSSSGQKRDGGYLSPLPKDIRKKTRMEGEPARVIRRCLDPDFESPINRGKDKCFGEMKRHKHPDGEAKVLVRPKFLKEWNFYYDEKFVERAILNFAACGDLNVFPWGKMLCGFPYCFQVFLYETIPTLMDRGICVLKENSNLRISSWMESGKTPTNEQLNDTVFGYGQLRIDSVLNSEFKKLVEERLNSLKSSIVKVSEAIEKLRCDFVDQLLTTQTEIITQVKSTIKDAQFGHVDKRKSFGDVNESAGGVVIVDDILVGSGGAHSGSIKATPCSDGVYSQKNNVVLDKTIKNAKNTNAQNVATEKFEARDQPRDEVADVEKEPIIQEYPSFDLLCEGKSKCPEDEADMTSSNLMDDIIFSTQDIKIIDALEKSVGKVVTRGKRAVVMSSVCRSPFTTEFGSTECRKIVPYSKDIRKGLCAFPLECLKMPERHEIEMFEQWFRIGFNSRKRVYKFPGCSDIIDPPLSFGVTTVSSKMWFYNLLTPNKWLDHDLGDINVLARDTDICDYILGYSMCINTPWVDVDYILFPINMDGPAQWFLLVFDVHRRRLVVYNTFNHNSINMQTKIMDVCEPYILGLPIFCLIVVFGMEERTLISEAPGTVIKILKMQLSWNLKSLFQSRFNGDDCGVFTIGFAEYFMWRRMDDFCRIFEVKEYQ
ncbi:hypothetical protein OROMI_003955 [Orobanche minor]